MKSWRSAALEEGMAVRKILALCAMIGCAAASAPSAAQLQSFPSRPLRIIVPFPPGGSADDVIRMFSNRLAELTGQSVILDNRPGASGNVGTDLAARAAADGHTLLATTLPLAINPSLFAKLNHDVLRDFAPVSLVAVAPFVLVVHPSLPASSVKELIAYARVRPGELNYASAGSGTNLHVAAELFKYLARLDIVHVPYKGGAPAMAALLGGETHIGFIEVLAAGSYAKAGRIRVLGVTGVKRSLALAGVPTVAESGLPDYEFTSWYGVLAPRATAPEKVVALNGHIRNALRGPEMAERFAWAGAEIIASTPEEFDKRLRAELAKWAKVVKAAGLKAE
jgi:tripartite-type tricarboxylate transporter receptor subunit TctC